MKAYNNKVYYTLTICVAMICTFFVNNKIVTPDIMEVRNIITAREMVHDGNYMVPTMNGELRLEKPPLPTWITAVAEIVTPGSLFMYRAMSGLAAVVMVVFFMLTAKILVKERYFGEVSAAILCTCYSVVLMGRTASWDIYCHAFMMVAIYFMFRSSGKGICSITDFATSGVFMGLSFMSKGPVSFYALLLPFALSFATVYKPKIDKRFVKAILTATVICVAVGGAWYAYMYMFHGDEMSYVAGKESSSWLNYNVRPWWYYRFFFLESGVWSVLLLTAIALPLWSKSERRNREYIFILVWMILQVVLLSVLPEKKNRYLLPVMIPASYLMGYVVVLWNKRAESGLIGKTDKSVFRVNAILLAVVFVCVPSVLYLFVWRGRGFMADSYVFATIAVALAIGLVVSVVKLKPLAMVTAVALLFVAAELFVLPSISTIVNNPEMKSMRSICDRKELDSMPFYYNSTDSMHLELVYAAARKIRPADFSNVETMKSLLPCVVVTHARVGSELSAGLWQYADSIYVDNYDENRWKKSHKRYKPELVYHATILRAKSVEEENRFGKRCEPDMQ